MRRVTNNPDASIAVGERTYERCLLRQASGGSRRRGTQRDGRRRLVVLGVTVGLVAALGTVVLIGRGESAPSLTLQSGADWFPTTSQGSVTLIDGTRADRVTRVDGVATPNGHVDVAQEGPDALVLDRATAAVRRVDGATWTASSPLTIGTPGDSTLAVTTGGGAAWVVTASGSEVEQLDPASMTIVGDAHALPRPVVADAVAPDGQLWEIESSGEVRAFRNASQRTIQAMLGAGPWSLTLVGERPVVVDQSDGKAYVLDPDSGTPKQTVCVDAPVTPPPLLSGAGADAPWLVAVAPQAGALVVSDLNTGTCRTIGLTDTTPQARYGRAVEKGRLIYVPDFVTGHVLVIDPAAPPGHELKANVNLALPASTIDLSVDDNRVWFDQVGGDHAGVITENLQAFEISKSDPGSGDGRPVAPDEIVSPPSAPLPNTTTPLNVNATSTTTTAQPASPAANTPEFQLVGQNPGVDEPATFLDITPYPHQVSSWAVDGNTVSGAIGTRLTTSFSTVGSHAVTLTVTEHAGGPGERVTKDLIENEVEVSTDTQVADDSAAVLADPGFPTCVQAAFKSALQSSAPAGATIDSVKAARADITSEQDLGLDSANAFTVDIAITVQGQSANVSTGVVVLTSGRALSQVTSQATTPIDLAPTIKAAAANLKTNAPT
jgi:hypothetical protein